MSEAINNRYEFVILFDVENGNPNGDIDAGNAPRIDPETGYGFVTDVCLKRKIRNYVELVKDGEAGYNIIIKADKPLNSKFMDAYKELGFDTGKKEKNRDYINEARAYMCKNYFDVRTFGAVMSTTGKKDDEKYSCGTVRGPVQITFANSVSPISYEDVTITRQARTTEERQKTGDTEIGHKSIIHYALYRAEGYISAAIAQKITGFTEEDKELLFEAIENMFEHDHSAARGKMCTRKLFVFKHESVLGNAPSSVLFDKIRVEEKNPGTPVRSFNDYIVTIDENMPQGVTLEVKL